MNKRIIVLKIMLLVSIMVFGQEKQTIKVIVPNKTDEVYITGNQEVLGNWNPKSLKMEKISDYERSITVDLTYPAEFKFTQGDWNSEGIIRTLNNNPNQKLESSESKNIFIIKGWSNAIDGTALGLDYQVEFLPSKYVIGGGRQIKIVLPINYDPNKKYPVFYITDSEWRNFEVAKNYLESMSGDPYGIIPETILVGIVHGSNNGESNRNKDLDVLYEETGQQFKNFLFQELIPHINEEYSTSGFNVMIGHSNGAEYNHYLFLEEDNPFRGFISISTNFYGKRKNKDVDTRMGNTMKNYAGDTFYYFVANAKYDSPDRIQAGDDYENMYNKDPNPKLQFQKKFYEKGHNSVVPPALFDAISFVYKDYKQLEKYKTFYDLRDNYAKDMKDLYGLDIEYTLSDVESLFSQIFETKDKKQLDALYAFIEKHKIFPNGVTQEKGGVDAMNQGNIYYHIGAYETSALKFEEALNQINITVEPMVYFGNFDFVVDCFKNINDHKTLMEILIQSRDFAASNKVYDDGNKEILLKLHYLIATLSAEHNISKEEGEKAKQYCIDNYYQNKLFKLEEMKQLSI
ncbi:alpha/beta hydrolase-fold protein [Algoriphagus limi]|uniref:Alpha/beta hydrolase-fold protein n=1 Tax=Algoriphagus limi TaxID=2975273 RepID=A0ABT2GD02_9BACT|nr:alpha/beta hydrolase-fold protein [Algoriphagus limi]MCS5491797.1 alpha/beta hydrolase-fold protein [Algoriphagus limi]